MRIDKFYCGYCERYCLSRNFKHVLFFSVCASRITAKWFWIFMFIFLQRDSWGLAAFSLCLCISVGFKPLQSSWKFLGETVGVALINNVAILREQSCVWRVTLHAFVFGFELISFLFTFLIRRQKLALIMLFSAEYSFNCYSRKTVRKGF